MYYQLRPEIIKDGANDGWAIYQGANPAGIAVSQRGVAWPSDIGRHSKAANNQMAFDVTE
jgi:hypothetical protein